jgi:hypothetical protein
MQHTLRFLSGDNGHVLLEETTLAYGLMSGYERGTAALGLPAGRQVRVELLDDTGHLLDWRTYVVRERVAQYAAGASASPPRPRQL